jgi:hypothetical protein
MNKTAACTSALVMSTRNGAKHQNNSVEVGTLTAAPSHGGCGGSGFVPDDDDDEEVIHTAS